MPALSTIHVHQDVAPLKRCLRVHRSRETGRYPRPSGRGSIEAQLGKLTGLYPAGYPRPSGRGSIEACLPGSPISTVRRYPRPSGRGSIEATRSPEYPATISPYPRLSGRGSIEARLNGLSGIKARCFYPRPSGRGSIEAPTRLTLRKPPQGPIHVHQDVAPLKQTIISPGDLSGYNPIHVHQDVAPLKRESRGHPAGRQAVYPRPSGRGSIEAIFLILLPDFFLSYPRPSGRGSIEALPTSCKRPTGDGSIHVHQDVAPLKLSCVLPAVPDDRPIHVHQDVAPLKPNTSV